MCNNTNIADMRRTLELPVTLAPSHDPEKLLTDRFLEEINFS